MTTPPCLPTRADGTDDRRSHACERCGSLVRMGQTRYLCYCCYRELLAHVPRPGDRPAPALPPSQTERWLTTREAAALVQVQPDTIRRYVRAGRLPAQSVSEARHPGGRRYRFRRRDVQALLHGPPEED